MTSHDVVSRVRRLAGTRRVGHAGTLDPMATGVLVLGLGRATRLLTHVTGHSKTYEATIRLGVSTHTDDAEGRVLSATGCPGLGTEELEALLAPLRGDIMQVPTSVSAIKVDGKRAHALVREGKEVELAARPVRVDEFVALGAPRPRTAEVDGRPLGVVDVDVRVSCSAGTYVRALARDAGAALGVGAHLTALRRTRVGVFGLEDAQPLPGPVAEGERGVDLPILGLDEAVARLFPRLVLAEEEAARFRHGQAPRRRGEECALLDAEAAGGPIGVFDGAGHAMGLVEVTGRGLRTVLVLAPEEG